MKALAFLALLATTAMPAYAATLTNGTGDGTVSIDVDSGGYSASGTYDPIGDIPSASVIYQTGVYFRLGSTGARQLLSGTSTVDGTDLQRTSSFTVDGVSFTLVQTLSELSDNGVRTGSLLTQTYSFTNTSTDAQTVELTRYLDGDLQFDGSNTDGGGRLFRGDREILFETDSATGAADSATFIGIYTEGGTSTGYEISGYSGLRSKIGAGVALNNGIVGDTDGDGFIDAGNGYDVTLGLGRSFSLAGGASGTFTTGTIFGTGAPGSVVIPGAVPEPATWGMMILGFGLVGAAARRRRATAAHA